MTRPIALLCCILSVSACATEAIVLDPDDDDGSDASTFPTSDAGSDAGTTADGAMPQLGDDWIVGPWVGGRSPAVDIASPAQTETFDVVVFGAGTGGTAAALQAARMGASVALVEETDWVGGQMTTAGVSVLDEGGFNDDAGVYGEFLERVRAHYDALGKRSHTCGIQRVPCLEPSVGQQILRDMLSTEGVTLFERTTPAAGRVTSGDLVSVRVRQMAPDRVVQFDAAVFVDATEYGDLIPFSGNPWRVGNSTSDALDPTACVQDITVAPIIRKYDSVPDELKFDSPPPGYGPATEQKFANVVVAMGGADWEAEGWGAGYPTDWKTHVSYRATPDSARSGDSVQGDFDTLTRTGVNWANDYPYTVEDLESRRFAANCEAKLHTLQFLYYVQNVMGIEGWAIANDEGYDTPYNIEQNDCPEIPAAFDAIERHMNPIPYVRESRRMVGVYTMVGPDIDRPGGNAPSERRFANSVAVGDYAMDLHACDEPADLETQFESLDDRPPNFRVGPFQIPIGVLIARDVDGLLAAEKNISQSRLVNGATRLQPSTMATGQAVGALAALAVSRGEDARDVPPVLVQDALVEAGARIGVTKFPDVPLDSAAWSDVEFVSGRGILIGNTDGSFDPNGALTRAQAAIYLARLFELNVSAPPATASFSDVPTSHFAFAAVEALKTAGITSGCGDGTTFCPGEPTLRGAMATFIARGLGFSGTAPQGPTFSDVPSTSPHYDAIEYLYSIGVVSGCSTDRYCGNDPTTRRQAAAFARRTLLHVAR